MSIGSNQNAVGSRLSLVIGMLFGTRPARIIVAQPSIMQSKLGNPYVLIKKIRKNETMPSVTVDKYLNNWT
jgi:hypothetical protein